MKVILFLFYSEGGMYHYCLSLAFSLAKYCNVYLFLPKSAKLPEKKHRLTYIVYDLPKLNNFSSFIKIINLAPLLMKFYKINPNIIHFPNTNYILWFLLPLLRKYPTIVTIHDPYFHPYDFSIAKNMNRRFILRHSDSIIVHDKYGKEIITKNIDSARVFRIRHISFESVIKQHQKQLEKRKGDYVLFFGRLHKYKGIDILVDSAYKLQGINPSIKIKIYGKGNIDSLKAKIKQCSNIYIENRYILDEEIPYIFLNSQFVVLPYTSASQSGIIPIAYYFGKPVLVTRVGGLPESVTEGITGTIIQPNDPIILAEKIDQFWNFTNNNYEEIKINCNLWLKTHIAPSVIAIRTIKAYLKTINFF